MDFRYSGIPQEIATEVRATMRAPEYGHPAFKALAQGYGPCRLCLRTFRVGADERILFTYNPFVAGELPAPGPVFPHAGPCELYEPAELPADFRELPMVLEGYGEEGRLLSRERVAGRTVAPML